MSLAQEQPSERLAEASTVALALGALRTDLDDCLSRDPEGLFRILRTDAMRVSLYNLLAKLPAEAAAGVLEWMAEQTPPADAAALLLRAGLTPVGARLAAAERRTVFERLLAPARLALVLDLCRVTQAGGMS